MIPNQSDHRGYLAMLAGQRLHVETEKAKTTSLCDSARKELASTKPSLAEVTQPALVTHYRGAVSAMECLLQTAVADVERCVSPLS